MAQSHAQAIARPQVGYFRRNLTCKTAILDGQGGAAHATRLGPGSLSVRGLKSVSRVILHKLAGWNVLRTSASKKMKDWVAETLGIGDCGGPGSLFHGLGRLVDREIRVFCRVA